MKFTPRDGKVSVGISCVLFKSGRLPSNRDKVRLQDMSTLVRYLSLANKAILL